VPLVLTRGRAPLLDLSSSPHVVTDGVEHRGLERATTTERTLGDGVTEVVICGDVGAGGLRATLTVVTTASSAGEVSEVGLDLHNRSADAVTVTAADPVCGQLGTGRWQGHALTSSWGSEFEPVTLDLAHSVELSSVTGRSSNGWHPWCALHRSGGGAFVVAPAWSGNWRIRVQVDPAGHPDAVTAGISPWRFARSIAPGDSFSAPDVVLATGETVDDTAGALAGAVRTWSPRTVASDAIPVEWNHWWPYEDRGISADVFLANAEVAQALGFEICVLDAGWFGEPTPDSDWGQLRGDWGRENTARFPGGITGLAQQVREAGMQFGIWCELEAVGAGARIRTERPELMARRDDDPPQRPVDQDDPGWLGYVCLGSPTGREHAAGVLDGLVERTRCTWIKLDFNLDPGAGCSRTDHGHGAGDGLFEHYVGLYGVLDDFRRRHPEVVLEACSSGGLRIDLGLARHVHCFFLSDPDWPEHHLQVVWGASLMLPPSAILHWSSSEWRGVHRQQTFDVTDPGLTVGEFDAAVRGAMLHRFGLSIRLTELPTPLRSRLTEHVLTYEEVIRPFVVDGLLHRLTAMPRREGLGERQPAFQLELQAGDRHLIAVFRLPGAADPPRAVVPRLRADTEYVVHALDEPGGPQTRSGADLLTTGLPITTASTGAQSWLFLLEPRHGQAPGIGG
jgi:alpha-galactosidase